MIILRKMARQSSKMLIPYGDPLLRILILYDTCSLAKIDSGLIFDVILDDRNERAGVKFNDMDLIAVPMLVLPAVAARLKVWQSSNSNVLSASQRNKVQEEHRCRSHVAFRSSDGCECHAFIRAFQTANLVDQSRFVSCNDSFSFYR